MTVHGLDLATGLRAGGHPVEEALDILVEVAEALGLKPISQHTEHQVAGQMVRRSPTEYRTPPCPQTRQIEIAQARDLGFHSLMTNRGLSHGRQAARRVDFFAAGLGASGRTIR
jgi:hypothetical protein